ncbi:toll/interleukin-1 receptor domain-containing protein [Carnobacterium maltaromaticum]|nr:hypothetical protein IV75_GL000212 [Carnobacterium maltaromaticum]
MGILEICDEQKEFGGEKMEKLKFFISHSTKDEKLVKDFIFFLREGLDIKKSEVFCTSLNNALPIGSEFIPVMKEKIGECNQVVFLITENYLKSKFCLAEMGAAWALNQKIIPIIVSPIDYASLDDTPLKGIQVINLKEEDDLYKLTTQLVQEQVVGAEAFTDVRKNMEQFLSNFNS